jgi:hypothetical protein
MGKRGKLYRFVSFCDYKEASNYPTTRVELHPGDYVTISASRYPFPSVLPLNKKKEDWIDSISRTLNWNSRQRQKKFDEK